MNKNAFAADFLKKSAAKREKRKVEKKNERLCE